MNRTQAKEIVLQTAAEIGFSRTVVASLEPMDAERIFFQEWLDRGFAGTMHYLERNPYSRTSPQLLYPEAYCALVLFAPYFTESPPDPGKQFGRVARYAVGKDYHEVIPAKLEQLKSLLEQRLGRSLLGKYFTDDVELFEPGFARRAGLGFIGKNTMVIGPRLMGSYYFVCELFTDLELEPDEVYRGTCGKCFRCGISCPTTAIVGDALLDARLCISFLTIENKAGIPLALRKKLGDWVFGCDVCQEVCPYNQAPVTTTWKEFYPEEGAGHFLDLYEILKIKDKKDLYAKLGNTPLTRPKRRGLIRNALVVIGNRQPEDGPEVLFEFACAEPDAMLREHAAWALSNYSHSRARKLLHLLIEREPDELVRIEMYALACGT